MLSQGVTHESYISILPNAPIEHLAKTVYCAANWRDVVLVMLSTAFDASGSEDDRTCTVVAGFISDATEWIKFDGIWRKRLGEDGLLDFRMSQFTAHKGPFSDETKWTQPKRDRLIADLIDIIIPHVFRKFGCAVLHPALEQMPADMREANRITAYSLAGRSCVGDVIEWARENPGFHRPISFVFEDGDKGKGKLMERLETDDCPLPIFEPKVDKIKNGIPVLGFTPLQAADIYAYEIRVRLTKLHVNRRSFTALDSIPGFSRAFNEAAIATFSMGLVPPEDQLIVLPPSLE
jgi:hypothetical protein